MSISTSTDFTMTRNEIITDALLTLNIIAPEETPGSSDVTFASRALNRMIKGWQAQGIHLFQKRTGVIFLQKGQSSYSLSTTGDHASTVYENTTTSASAISAATAIVVTSTEGMTAADYIGIELSTGYLQWTTITSIVGSTINLNSALTSSVNSSAYVYTYTTRSGKMMDLHHSQRRDISSSIDTSVTILSNSDYYELSNKTATGYPNQIYYDVQDLSGTLYVWPVPADVRSVLVVTYNKVISDLDAATDNPDFPTEWLDAIIPNLAVRIAPAYGKPVSELLPLAIQLLNEAKNFDQEKVSLIFTPYSQSRYR